MAMANKKEDKGLCSVGGLGSGCCQIQSLISVDERGQMVLPKDIRDKAEIAPGDKLAVVSWEKKGKVCCLFLIKADDMVDYVKEMLGPLTSELLKK